MSAEELATVAAAVVTLTQLVKWMGLPDSKGPFAVIGFAVLGIALHVYSTGTFARELLFNYFAGWLVVATSAAGVFGFTRAGAAAVTALTAPPAGAGASPTIKS